MKPLPARDQDSPLNLRVVPMTWHEPKPSSIRPLWVKWFQNLRCVNKGGGCPDPCASVVVLASQSSLFQEVLEDEEFSSDWVTPRIIGLKNLSLGELEKFVSFLYTGHIVIMKSPHYPRPTEISSDIACRKNCPSCSVLGTMLWWLSWCP